ncbi:small ribosomal subunit protein mL103 (rPPR7)-like [Typha latifolia]|uniref:small ribosomal subunit protein mL103 (rPPR7)-like n=1 Tax=Typha latifolia TaxID=4733 RepID=UPI003C2D49BF
MAATLLRKSTPKLPRVLHRFPFSALPEPLPSSSPSPSPSSPPAPKPIHHLKTLIRSEPDPDQITSLFLSSTHLPRFHSNRPLFSLAVAKLSRLRRPDLVRSLLDPFLSDPNSPKSEGFLTRLISLYSSASLPDAALEAFLSPSPHPRSDVSLSALLAAFLRSRRFDEVKSIFNRAADEFKIDPGLVSHNVLLNALCENGELGDARKLLGEMSGREELKPNIVSYNTLLTGYLRTKDDEGFDEILKEIISRGLEPNVVTFNCRITRFCAKGESFKAEELLDVMISKGVHPNLATFNALIDGFCKEGDAAAALRAFKRMKVMKRMNGSEGVEPNADTYITLMRSLVEKGGFGEALWVSKECLAKKVAPPFEVVKGLVDGLMKESKVDEAKAVVAKMRMVVKGDAVDAWNKVEGELALKEEETAS